MAISAGQVFVDLGARLDRGEFEKYEQELKKAQARVAKRELFKAELGANFDARAFNSYERATRQAERDTLKARAATKSFGDELNGLTVKLPSVGKTMGLLKWPALISGAGIAAQAISTLTAGATALGAALAPLSGAVAAYPALGSAAAQGLGVWKLATQGLGEAVGGLNEEIDTTAEAFKALSPEAQQFAKHLDSLKPSIREIQRSAQRGLFPGVDKALASASKNLSVFERGVPRTSKVLGDLVAQAGRLVGSKGFGRDLETQMGRNDTTIRRVGEGGLHLANALRNVTLAAGPLVEWMTRIGLRFTEVIDKQAQAGRESGKLAHFFDETRIAISRVARIGADLAVAFFNISKEGKPLGDHILVNMVKLAEHFKDWTESARGRNAIVEYFRKAKEPMDELGRLVHDIGIDFVKLGQGDQIAPLLRTIRVDLLPRFVELVDQTTKAFGPPMLEAIKQVAILFTHLGGTNGPLTMLVTLVGKVAGGLNRVIDAVPQVGSAFSSLATIASLYATLRIAATLSGLTRIVRLIKDVRGAGAVGAVAGAGEAAAGGAAAGAATRRGAVGTVAAVVSRFPVAAIATAIVAAMGKPLLDTVRGRSPTGEVHSDKIASQATAIARFNRQLERLKDLGDSRGAARLAAQFDKLVDSSGKFTGSARDVNRLTTAARNLVRVGGTVNRELGDVLGQAGKHFADFRRTGSNNLHGLHTATDENMHFISRRFHTTAIDVGDSMDEMRKKMRSGSAAGREALARNFRLARTAVRQAMEDGKISVRDGLAEIQRLMRAELRQYGITGGVAKSIIKHGDINPQEGGGPGARDSGTQQHRAAGGWLGGRGLIGHDTIPAMLAPGEAVLNRHQQGVIESMLGDGFLDRLFAQVNRPHFMQRGGRIRFARGGTDSGRFLQLPENIHVTHQTAGLAGYPAQDIFASPGTSVGAPVSGVIARLSGQAGGPGGGGAYGYSIYENGSNNRSYFLTHFGSTSVRAGQHVRRGQTIGTVADYPGGIPDHIHEGVHGGLTGITRGGPRGTAAMVQRAWKAIKSPQTGATGLLGGVVQATLDRVTSAANRRGRSIAASTAGDPGGSGVVGPIKGHYGFSDLKGLWTSAGGAASRAALMAHIALAESGGDPNAQNPSGATGLWQILGAIIRGNLRDPMVNARNAVAKLRSQGLGAWAASRDVWGKYASRGGFMRFQKGGIAGAAGRIVGRAAGRGRGKPAHYPEGGATHRAIHILKGKQDSRVPRYDDAIADVESLQKNYARQERRFNVFEEELIDENGLLNTYMVARKAGELQTLIDIAERIRDRINDAYKIAKAAVKTYREIIARLTKSRRHSKGKDRKAIDAMIGGYKTSLSDFIEKRDTAKGDLFDAGTDLLQLRQERLAVLGTRAEATDTTASDTGDTSGADTAEPETRPPSPLELAEAAATELRTFITGRQELLTSFGRDFVPAPQGAAYFANPDPLTAAAGVRAFGAGGTGGGLGGSTIVNNYNQLPSNVQTWNEQMRFMVGG